MNNIRIIKTGINVSKILTQLQKYPKDWESQKEMEGTASLLDKGYSIRERNWRYQKAEVDIIALKENTLVAVEVKTRTSNYFGNPEDFVTKKKIRSHY